MCFMCSLVSQSDIFFTWYLNLHGLLPSPRCFPPFSLCFSSFGTSNYERSENGNEIVVRGGDFVFGTM